MDKYICKDCAHIYNPDVGDPDSGVLPGTPFENLPEDWVCPICGVTLDYFEVLPEAEFEKLPHVN